MPAYVSSVTTVLTKRNLTLDVHLVDDFVHLFDTNLTSDSNTNLLVLNIAFPAGVALAFEPMVSLVDTYYVGQYLGLFLIWLTNSSDRRQKLIHPS